MEDQEHTQPSGSPPPPASPLTVQDSDEEDGTLSLTVASKTPEKPEAQTTVDVPTRNTMPSTKAGRLRTSGGGGREDCWSDGATSTLIDAWGERFFELSRGNLKQKHWQEVADVVSSRDDYTRTPKTDVQCKNRIDTLKKKYKVEKSKMSSKSTSSDWPFFQPLDDLIGGNNPHNSSTTTNNNDNKSAKKKKKKKKKAQQKRSKLDLRFQLQACKKKRSKKKMIPRQLPEKPTTPPTSPPEFTGNGVGFENGMREMVKAVVKVGEVYERVERSKLEQAAEMEKQRMMFAKEMELQRMRFFMKSQLELTQLNLNQNLNCRKRRRMTGDDDDNRDVGDHEHAPANAADDSDSNSNNISGDSKKRFKNGGEL